MTEQCNKELILLNWNANNISNKTSGTTEWHRLSRISYLFPWIFASYMELPYTLS